MGAVILQKLASNGSWSKVEGRLLECFAFNLIKCQLYTGKHGEQNLVEHDAEYPPWGRGHQCQPTVFLYLCFMSRHISLDSLTNRNQVLKGLV